MARTEKEAKEESGVSLEAYVFNASAVYHKVRYMGDTVGITVCGQKIDLFEGWSVVREGQMKWPVSWWPCQVCYTTELLEQRGDAMIKGSELLTTPRVQAALQRLADGAQLRHSLMSGWTMTRHNSAIQVKDVTEREAGWLADNGYVECQGASSDGSPRYYSITEMGLAALSEARR